MSCSFFSFLVLLRKYPQYVACCDDKQKNIAQAGRVRYVTYRCVCTAPFRPMLGTLECAMRGQPCLLLLRFYRIFHRHYRNIVCHLERKECQRLQFDRIAPTENAHRKHGVWWPMRYTTLSPHTIHVVFSSDMNSKIVLCMCVRRICVRVYHMKPSNEPMSRHYRIAVLHS